MPLAGLLLAAALRGETPIAPPRAELDAALSARVRAYAWDDGPEVPTPEGLEPGAVPFGEGGLAPDTRLYVRFGGGPLDLAGGREVALARGASAGPGRYGPGLRLSTEASRLTARGGGAPLLAPPFTLELWVRPSAAPEGDQMLLEVPGVCSVRCASGGRTVLLAGDGQEVLLSAGAALVPSAWSHVALAVDGPELDDALRLVVDGAPAGCEGSAGLSRKLAAAGELRVGGLPCDVDELRVLGRALTSQELFERRDVPIAAGEHRLRLRLEGGEEQELVAWAGILRQAWVDRPAFFASVARDHLAIHPDGLAWVEGQWREDRPPVRPLARTTHPTVYVGDHRILIYGGETRDTHVRPWRNTDDTWIYAADQARWKRVAAGGPAPSPRCHEGAAWSPDHGLVFYPGGWRNDRLGAEEYKDVWVYIVAEERWEQRTPSGPPLAKLSNASVVYDPALKLFLVWKAPLVFPYDPQRNAWLPPQLVAFFDAQGAPLERAFGASAMIGFDPESERIVIFGGESSRDGQLAYHDDTLLYEPRENRAVLQELAQRPSPRCRSAFAHDSRRGRFVLYGGVQDQYSQRKDDLWTYVPGGTWQEIEAADGPGRRGGFYSMAYDPELDRFFLLCGRSAPERFHNDAWRLALDPEAEASAALVFDRSASSGCTRFAVRLSGGVAPRVRFAWSPDALAWSPWLDEPAADGVEGARFLKVELRLPRGTEAEAPRVQGLGLTDEDPAVCGPHVWELPG